MMPRATPVSTTRRGRTWHVRHQAALANDGTASNAPSSQVDCSSDRASRRRVSTVADQAASNSALASHGQGFPRSSWSLGSPVLLDRVEICGSNAEPFPSASIAALIELAAYSPDSSPGVAASEYLRVSCESVESCLMLHSPAPFRSCDRFGRSKFMLAPTLPHLLENPAARTPGSSARRSSPSQKSHIPTGIGCSVATRHRIVREEGLRVEPWRKASSPSSGSDPIPAPCNDGGRRGRAGAEPCQPVPFLDLRPMHSPIRDAVLADIARGHRVGRVHERPAGRGLRAERSPRTAGPRCVGVASGLDALRLALLAPGSSPAAR